MESLGEDDRALNTYSRGKRPINTILVTRGVGVSKAGYLPFEEGVGDHRSLFVDIVISSVLGVKLPSIETATARGLRSQDPILVNKYNKLLKASLVQRNAGNRSA